jgi:prevent-host-death family protein
VEEVGLREMRQHASELVRRAQAGERMTITVAGRPAAVLGPVSPRTWRRWDDVADIFAQPFDDDWVSDRDLVDGSLADPWTRQ